MTKKELGEFTVRVRDRMENDRFPLEPQHRQIRELWQEKASNPITHDLEFLLGTTVAPIAPKAMIKICLAWHDKSGKLETFQTIINHGMSVRRMYEIYGSRSINRGSLRKIYGEPSDNQTEGMTIEEVADRLEEIFSDQEIWMTEWSNGFCDYNLLYDSLDAIGRASIMPPKSRAFSLLNAWRYAMTGIPVVFQLSILHRIVIAYDSDLPKKRHKARADVLMTENLKDEFFKATLNAFAPTGILRYFKKAFKKFDVVKDKDSDDLLLLSKKRASEDKEQTGEERSDEDFEKSDYEEDDDVSDLDASDLDEPNLDDPSHESNDDNGDIISSPIAQRLLTDTGDEHAHRLVDDNASDGPSISLAIAALTCGIAQQGVMFNVASDTIQQLARLDSSHQCICLTEPNRFLVALTLSGGVGDCGSEELLDDVPEPKQRNMQRNAVSNANLARLPSKPQVSFEEQKALQQNWTAGIGHFMLVIAERTGRDVHLTFRNSLPEYVPQDQEGVVRRIARNIIRYSGWMGNLWPRFEGEVWPSVAPQRDSTCGLHVVLNAWAYILSLKLRDTPKWRNLQFYKEAREIINLALQGKTSATEIETWLLNKNFVDPRAAVVHATDSELQKIRQAHTVRMNENIFDDYLEAMHAMEKHSGAGTIAAPSSE